MALDDMDRDLENNGAPPPEESSNRTFLLVAGGLGALILLTLICLAAYALYFAPRQRAANATAAARIDTQNTEIAKSAKLTLDAGSWTATPTVTSTSVPATQTPTRTPVLAVTTAAVQGTTTADILTATVSALQTQLAAAQQTVTPSASGLPQTGFADEVGVPALVGLALVLIVVIFLARRLRSAGT